MAYPSTQHDVDLSAQPASAPSMQRAAGLFAQRPAGLSTQPAQAPSSQRASTSSVHSVVGGSKNQLKDCSATSPLKNAAPTRKNKRPRVSPDDLVIFSI